MTRSPGSMTSRGSAGGCMSRASPRPQAAPRVRLIAGGRSNLTYLLEPGEEAAPLVLRRPPLGHVLPTAHDMSREHRVLSALADTEVPVPAPVALCQDVGVIGAPFYLMPYVAGLVLRSAEDGERLTPVMARQLSESFTDMLAAIHGVDLDATGLDSFGRPEGYMAAAVFALAAAVGAVRHPRGARVHRAHPAARGGPARPSALPPAGDPGAR